MRGAGSWLSALALFVYAAGFSFAYISLSAATGALLLFGAVQVTMISVGLWKGERLSAQQLAGFVLAFGGLLGLLLPGLSAPPLRGALLMLAAGVAWGVYSLRAKGVTHPTRMTAGNFLRSVPFALVLTLLLVFAGAVGGNAGASSGASAVVDAYCMVAHGSRQGFGYAMASGAITSGAGYAIWYFALRGLTPASAATVQLIVPVLAALGGVVFLGEVITLRLLIASGAILGGIALVLLNKRPMR